MFFVKDPIKTGGDNDYYNDCLHNCLKEVLPRNRYQWNATRLKQELGLSRTDKVSTESITKLQSLLHINISIMLVMSHR